MTVPDFGLPRPGRYKKLVKHKPRPRKETKSFSKNETKIAKVNSDGSYYTQNQLSGKYTKYTKSGRYAKKQF